jgi:hypothetical protein
MSQTASNIVTGVSLSMRGSYIYRLRDEAGSLFVLPIGGVDSKDSRSRDSTALQFAGREYPVYDFGSGKSETLDRATTLTYSDDDMLRLSRLREMSTSSDTWVYRDKRGRKLFCVMTKYAETDISYGTTVSFTLTRVDFNEAVA